MLNPRAKKTICLRLFPMLVFFIILTCPQISHADKSWSFNLGQYQGEHFTMKVPSAISVKSFESDEAILLTTEPGDIILAISFYGNKEISLDYIAENVPVEDESYLASAFIPKNPDMLVNTLTQTARINRKDIEMLEYRFDIEYFGEPWIAYNTFIKIKGFSGICEIDLLGNKLIAATAKLYYTSLIDSVVVNENSKLGEEEWVCDNCDTVCNGNFCSNCGNKKDTLASTAMVEAPSFGDDTGKKEVTNENSSEYTSSSPQNQMTDVYNDVVAIAKDLAKLLAYTATEPVIGTTVSVNIDGKNISVHADFKYAMDIFYEFYKEYFDSISNLDFQKMMELAVKAEDVDAALEKIDDMELSDGDMAYYMSIYANILEIISSIGST